MGRLSVVTGALGLGLGVVMGLWLAPEAEGGGPTAATAPAAASGAASSPSLTPSAAVVTRVAGTASSCEDAVADHQEALASVRLHNRVLQARLKAHEGDPQEFPEGLDPAYTEEGFEDRFREALSDRAVGELVDVECYEFPCMAYLVSDDERLAPSDDGDPYDLFFDDIKGRFGEDTEVRSMKGSRKGSRPVMVFAVWPEGMVDADVATRTEYRLNAAYSELNDDFPLE